MTSGPRLVAFLPLFSACAEHPSEIGSALQESVHDSARLPPELEEEEEEPSERPGNVLILLVDDVGVDKISADSPLPTPNIDRLAASGMRFENAWSLPYCAPTRAALMTGRHARRTGHGSNDPVNASPHELDPGQLTLAEVVSQSPLGSYDSSYIGKWHLSTFRSPSGPSGPQIQGWNWFTGILGNPGVWFGPRPAGDAGYYLWQKVDPSGRWAESRRYLTTDNVDEAIGRLGAMQEPWLMQVSFSAAHGPYDIPPAGLLPGGAPLLGGSVKRREQAIISALDKEIGRLLSTIPRQTRARTTIMFLSDNGTPHLAVEDQVDPDRSKGSVYEPGIHVPLIVSGPLVARPGSSSQALVHVVDILPTVADIVGVDLSAFPSVTDPSEPLQLDGESLLPLMADPLASAEREFLYSELFWPSGEGPYQTDIRAVRDERYKLIVDAANGIEQFFEYPLGGTDEGLDLLPCGLTPEQEEARSRLRRQMDDLVDSLAFDAQPFAEGPDAPGGASDGQLITDISCASTAHGGS